MSAPAFALPTALEAQEPPEARGLAREDVRLLVARRADARIWHAGFGELPELLNPGDLLVINVSATLASAAAGTRDGVAVRVHFGAQDPRLGEHRRMVELRSADGARPLRGHAGERVVLEHGAALELLAPYASGVRLLVARLHGPESVGQHLKRYGEPIRYGHLSGSWPLRAYQTVYASTPGSAEMPSAGRPFSAELITRLAARGVLIAPVTLHTGLSSPERHEPPVPEQFEVPSRTAALVKAVHGWGGRVIAVGTTVVRALETVAGGDGEIAPGSGWTSCLIEPERGLSVVDGLITGWHEPEASHLLMLEAAAGEVLLARSYRAALAHGYLWHEFGDSHLILP